MRSRAVLAWVLGCGLCAGMTGCESFQRKFTRKPKQPQARPTPIIQFQDYSRAMTPVERYRKHYMIFDYWNQTLLEALASPPLNPKRYRHAAEESLAELKTMQQLVSDEVAAQLAPILEDRERVTRQLQQGDVSGARAQAITRLLEAQAREIHRGFFWRDVEQQLKPAKAASAEPAAAAPGDAPSP